MIPFERGDRPVRLLFELLFLLMLFCLPGCADVQPVTAAPQQEDRTEVTRAVTVPVAAAGIQVTPEWQALRLRLAADGLSGPEVDRLLATLGPRTQAPMGRKMRELYTKRFLSTPDKKPAKPAPKYYKGVVTRANAVKCADFIRAHRQAFARAQQRYGVPPSTAAALLFVETRLGTVLRDVPENALHTLASMSQSTTLASISDWHGTMPGCEKHGDWFAATMPRRADWAYNETRALVRYMVENQITPDMLPGSIYGAIGLCQFMPSNIAPYGVDGNGDGVIDLYTADDAVMSLASYLARHGWKPGASREAKHRALMRYNKSVRYANTILGLGDLVAKELAAQPGRAAGAQQQ